jgi:ubiquinone/menaquinone biosynthesis C-methylase UbiE
MTLSRLMSRLYDPLLAIGERRGMAARRHALLESAHGRVLEVGAGTGLNLPHYPEGIGELVLSEPDPPMRARLERRLARSGRRATIVAAPAESLPFADGEFDTVVSTLVLCTVADAPAAIRELRRVLAPGGRLLLIEHVRASSPRLARWQDRLAAPWQTLALGCRCNQPTLELLEQAQLHVDEFATGRWRGMPAVVHPLVMAAVRR